MNRPRVPDDERLRRWRLVLGGADDGTGAVLHGADVRVDAALGALYDTPPGTGGTPARRRGGLGSSAPAVARWLGDIRRAFPAPVVQVLQRDAIERHQLKRLLLEPEMLASVEPDVHLVGVLLELNALLPDTTRAVARQVVAKVVADLEARLAGPARQAVTGALRRGARSRRPRPADVDWNRTIAANLRHWLPELGTVVPERLVGHARVRSALERELVIAVDQSGSMAESVVHASVLAAALASLRALRVSLVAFDTAVVDLSDRLADPVDVLFGVQLGGGTDIARALTYCESLVTRPSGTVLVVVSDLYEGGDLMPMLQRFGSLVRAGVQVVVLLSLADSGAPAFDHAAADAVAGLGIPVFACTPDLLPELLAGALEARDVARLAAERGLVTRGATPAGER